MNGEELKMLKELMNAQTEVINGKLDLMHEQMDNATNQLTGRHAALIDIVQENSNNIKKLKKETSFFRWIQRNPGKSILGLTIFILIVVALFDFQDVINMLKDLPKMLIK